MKLLNLYILLTIILSLTYTSSAQSIADLQKQKQQTLARIATTSQLIEEGSKSQAQNTFIRK